MPFRAARRPPDLERVARILGSGLESPDGQPVGWVPDDPAALELPEPPEASEARAASVVRRLRRAAAPPDDEVARLDADLRRARRPGLLTLPDELRAGRRAVSSTAVVALLALVVAIGCLFVLRVLWAERAASTPDLAPGSSRTVQVLGGATAASGAAARDGPTTAPAATPAVTSAASAAGSGVVVHVVGQVVRPGLVRVRQGARVADAITGAGGARPGADVSALNLARLVVDGEQIRVPRPGEVPIAQAGPSGAAGASDGTGGTGGAAGAPVSLNTADVSALDTLPGVGPVLAQRIVDWRTEHGRFTSVDELGEVSGIGDKLMAQLRSRVTL